MGPVCGVVAAALAREADIDNYFPHTLFHLLGTQYMIHIEILLLPVIGPVFFLSASNAGQAS